MFLFSFDFFSFPIGVTYLLHICCKLISFVFMQQKFATNMRL
jgi:hypothetical protein